MNEYTIEEPNKRSTSLSIIAILSWIAEAFIFLALGIMMLAKDFFIENQEELLEKDTTGSMELFLNQIETQYDLILVYPFLLNIISFVGVLYMFKLKKIGFHIYMVTHIVLIVLAYIASGEIGWTGLMISLSFMGLYASNLKHMN